MKQLEELPERKRDQHENVQESEKQPLSSVKSSVFLVQWKPCRETHSTVKDFLLKLQRCLGAVCGMQWYAYATLGITMALLSFLMDFSVAKMLGAQQWLYGQLEGNFLLQFLCWTLYPACLCALAATFCQSICPFSTGSGIPEVRTMLAGIDMPLYLSLTNMFSKFLGLFCTLAAGSTVFLGKVGPFVHLSTMFAAYLDNMFSLLQGIKKEKTSDMLVVAAAVGVASCFGAPVSGVLFSVEVMGSHYSLRHYFPCFFSAACGALTFRFFSVWSGDMVHHERAPHLVVGLQTVELFIPQCISPSGVVTKVEHLRNAASLVFGILSAHEDLDVGPCLHSASASWILHAHVCPWCSWWSAAWGRSGSCLLHWSSFWPSLGFCVSWSLCTCWISLTTVAHILEKDSVQLQKAAGPEEVRHIVVASVQLQIPVVDSEDSQILVGFVQRSELLKFLHHCKTQNLQQQMDDVCCIQPVSSLLSPSSTVDMAYSMMSVLELQTLFVADKGKLVGCLTWSKMKEILQALAKEN